MTSVTVILFELTFRQTFFLTDLFVKDQKTLMLAKFTSKHASDGLVTFVTHKGFAVLFFLPSCCVNSLIMQTTASYSLQSSSFQVASDSVKGSNYVDSFISGTQDVNKTPHCASSKALVPRLPTECTQPLCFILTVYYHS